MGLLTAPATLLTLVLATLAAAFFHMWMGEKPRDLILYWPVAVAGFLLGQYGAERLGFRFAMIGEVHVVEALGLSFAAMLVAKWLKV